MIALLQRTVSVWAWFTPNGAALVRCSRGVLKSLLEVQSKSLCVRQRRTTKKKECVIVEAHFKGGLKLKGLFLVKGVECCEGGALVAVM